MNRHKLYRQALSHWGRDAQITKAIEEMAELTQALCRWWSNPHKLENVSEEMADVEIMLEQLEGIFENAEEIAQRKDRKLSRLEARLNHEIKFGE